MQHVCDTLKWLMCNSGNERTSSASWAYSSMRMQVDFMLSYSKILSKPPLKGCKMLEKERVISA